MGRVVDCRFGSQRLVPSHTPTVLKWVDEGHDCQHMLIPAPNCPGLRRAVRKREGAVSGRLTGKKRC